MKKIGETIDFFSRKYSETLNTIRNRYEEYVRGFGELKVECEKLEELKSAEWQN